MSFWTPRPSQCAWPPAARGRCICGMWPPADSWTAQSRPQTSGMSLTVCPNFLWLHVSHQRTMNSKERLHLWDVAMGKCWTARGRPQTSAMSLQVCPALPQL